MEPVETLKQFLVSQYALMIKLIPAFKLHMVPKLILVLKYMAVPVTDLVPKHMAALEVHMIPKYLVVLETDMIIKYPAMINTIPHMLVTKEYMPQAEDMPGHHPKPGVTIC